MAVISSYGLELPLASNEAIFLRVGFRRSAITQQANYAFRRMSTIGTLSRFTADFGSAFNTINKHVEYLRAV